jgi:type 1 fimbria pilin
VTFGGVAASRVGWSPDGTTVFATTPPSGAGAVDVVVTNRAGQAVTLPQGFTYGLATPLLVTAISPNVGAAAGGTYLAIAGSGFQFGAKVTLDGVAAAVRYQSVATALGLTTRPHQAGNVDVVVTNPDGQVVRLNGGYTYASPQFKDFNGEWEGRFGEEGESPLRFTVESDVLVSLSCAGPVTLTSPPATSGGEFSIPGNGSPGMTGALVGADYAEGTINLAACMGYSTTWFATKH